MLLSFLSLAWASTTVTIESMSVDGQEVRHLSCELDKGGFFASAAIVGAVAGQKAALEACMPTGGAARVAWAWADSKVISATVSHVSVADAGACVVTALQAMKAPFLGSCKAVLLMGPVDVAQKAAETLPE